MKTEYSEDNYILKILDERSAGKIRNFYYDNRYFFEPFETDKPSDFYTKNYISRMVHLEYALFTQLKHVRYYLFVKGSDEIIGTVSLGHINRSLSSCTIGYKIAAPYAGNGIGTKMVSMALKAAVTDGHMHRIEAYILPDNKRSLRLCRSLGFIREGKAHAYAKIGGQWRDHVRYVYIAR